MLQAIRERSQGWFAWVIVVLISVPFALWGIQEYIRVGSQPPVATVNGHKISDRELSQQMQQMRSSIRSRMGRNYRPEMLDQMQLRKNVLDSLIRDQLTIDTSLNLGLRIGDEQVQAAILDIPAFQKDGQFDDDTYQRLLAMQGTSTAQFEERVRTSLMTNQLNRIVSSSEFTTDQDLTESITLRHQQRSFKYFLLPIAGFKTKNEISEQDLNAYYQAHRKDFEIPEQVKLDYVLLEQTDGTPTEGVTDANLQALYQSNIKQYQTPEQRQIRHILVALNPKATSAEEQSAKKRIGAIRDRIIKGADFTAVAKEVSEDPGSATQGGDLGMVGRGIMDREFERAAFALPPGKLSEPIRSAFGFHLIEVTKIQPEHTKPFAEVRSELAASARAEELSKHYLSTAERLGNLAYEHSDSLEPVAQAIGLKIQHSDWLSKSKGGGIGILADPKLIAAAFSDEVLIQGNNSDLIEIVSGHGQQAIVLRVAEHRDATIKSLAQVKSQIVETLQQERAKQSALKQADEIATRLRKGEALAQVAPNYKVIEQPLIQRDATKPLPPEVLVAAFKLPKTMPKTPSVGVVQTQDGSSAVIVLDTIQDGNLKELDEAKRKSERRDIAQTQAQAYYDDMLTDLKQRADIWIAPQDEHPVTAE